ncbi:BTB/POZ and TAZ domain-containing protein 5 (BTB and TAZ domain protein 5) [Durusdinium trenchii]|uniref:BTB/POZ and TAZ domain-containing protein 5 (BTB and TAZ domain protein 5) n=1 Tax=Durusdinium trenchii TaxID=1381693 RepID=A0ABP0LNJ7_9DINO
MRVDHEWLWQALRLGQHDLVTSLAPREFDWKSCHPLYGTPLMATVHNAVLCHGGKQEEERMHELIRWLMAMGADPRSVANRAEAMSVGLPPSPPGPGWKVYDDNGHIWWQYDGMLGLFWCEDSKKTDSDSYSCPGGDPCMKVMAEEHTGHSAISLVLAIKRKLDLWNPMYRKYSERIDKLASVFTTSSLTLSDNLMLINRHIVQTWSNALGNLSSADVELQAADSSSVWAHSLVLCSASEFFKAALSSPMREGQTQKIPSNVSEEALRHLVSLIYTGCPDKEHPMSIHLEALDLAHRWQLDHLVDALETKLVKELPDITRLELKDQLQLIDGALEQAVLKRLPRLRSTCHRLVTQEQRLKDAALRGELGTVACKDLAGVVREVAGTKRKKSTLELT